MSKSNWELRWFFEGSIPSEIEEWRIKTGFEEPGKQDDNYLLFPECDDLGIKLSRGEFQIKFRRNVKDLRNQDGRVIGIMEQWAKRIAPISGDREDPLDAFEVEAVFIEKMRSRKRFEVNLETKTVTPAEGRVDEGISVEVTSISHAGKQFWTLGFDSLGEEEKQLDILTLGASRIIEQISTIEPKKEDSNSYPAWCQKL